MRPLLLALTAVAALSAQDAPPALENLGKPMKIAYQCTEEEIHSAGLSCTEDEPCPVYLELSGLEPVDTQLFAIGNIHSSSVTLHALALASADGGKTWREAFPRIAGASLDQVRFADFEYGWISGQMLSPLPRDPF